MLGVGLTRYSCTKVVRLPLHFGGEESRRWGRQALSAFSPRRFVLWTGWGVVLGAGFGAIAFDDLIEIGIPRSFSVWRDKRVKRHLYNIWSIAQSGMRSGDKELSSIEFINTYRTVTSND